ncbi:MAG: ThiF family adenylyltransferase [Kiritimatiellae bacterium]|nr:ThiF family adenylyltransferase [Kiritimatiellia bacterium]
MNNTMFLNSIRSVRFNSNGFHPEKLEEGQKSATASQEQLPGFNQQNLRNARIQMIGCGGIGGSILDNLVRKGCGHVDVYDGDDVELGNLGRQKFFPSDVGKNKALCGARNAMPHASWPTEIVAHPVWFEDAVNHGMVGGASAAIVGPDRDSTRVYSSRYFYKMCPVLFVGIGTRAEHGYVFVQKPGEACFACLFPDATTNKRAPCPGTPAMIDILLVTAGLVLTALDALLMPGRKINWNYWDIYPSGAILTQPLTIERRKDCPICGKFG